MDKTKSGFTIVELLIVIVVIAILAAISIVAYNGMQNRADNSKTVAAATAYIKAMKLYKVDNGTVPQVTSCLGEGYTSNGDCHSTSASYTENRSNLNSVLLEPYFKGNIPTPTLKSGDFDGSAVLTGGIYNFNNYISNGGGIGLRMSGTTNCPEIGGANYLSTQVFADGTARWCRYTIN